MNKKRQKMGYRGSIFFSKRDFLCRATSICMPMNWLSFQLKEKLMLTSGM